MKLTNLFRFGAPFLGVLLLASTASASFNLFTPVSGSDFTPLSSPNTSPLIHFNGSLFNPASSQQTAEVSLGHSQGGSGNNFTVYVRNDASVVQCTLFAINSASGAITPFGPASSSALNGNTSFTISTSLPTGDFFYSLDCTLPAASSVSNQAAVVGVSPNH